MLEWLSHVNTDLRLLVQFWNCISIPQSPLEWVSKSMHKPGSGAYRRSSKLFLWWLAMVFAGHDSSDIGSMSQDRQPQNGCNGRIAMIAYGRREHADHARSWALWCAPTEGLSTLLILLTKSSWRENPAVCLYSPTPRKGRVCSLCLTEIIEDYIYIVVSIHTDKRCLQHNGAVCMYIHSCHCQTSSRDLLEEMSI